MKFKPPLQRATFLRRYKRFLADVVFEDGQVITVHCPNTGSMRECLAPNSPCWLSYSDKPTRKYAHTWEIATTPQRKKAGVNTARANALVVEAITNGVVSELTGYRALRQEVPFGEENSRVDILLHDHPRLREQYCYVEIKNVTYAEGKDGTDKGRGLFPDAVSARGTKHLRELTKIKASGHRAVLFFCVQHTGIDWVEAAAKIDPVYAQTLREAVRAGVEVIAYRAIISAKEITLREPIPFRL